MEEKSGKNIFLTGFMGSGKTTVGRYLAKKLAKTYVDLDQTIQERYGMSIAEIFLKYGEEFFREKEAEILKLLSAKKNQVVALGGGSLIRFENLKAIKDKGTVVYLRAELSTLLKRLAFEKESRPLLKNKTEKEMEELFNKRHLAYKDADISVNTDELSVAEVTELIVEGINKCQKY